MPLLLAKDHGRLDPRRLFPAMFTLMISFLFFVPAATIVRLGATPEIAAFVPLWLWAVALVPAAVAAAHWLHVRAGAPSKAAALLALVVPSLTLLVYSGRIYLQAGRLSGAFHVAACDAVPQKLRLQQAWDVAQELYASCLEDTSKRDGVGISELKRHFRFQDCGEYVQVVRGDKAPIDRTSTARSVAERGQAMQPEALAEDWSLLRYLEETQYCSGWCEAAEPLWTEGRADLDPCSLAVAESFRLEAKPRAAEVAALVLAVLFPSLAVVGFAGPTLRKWGIEW
eukprot:CAMPEP_0170255598 /NCGR_PEP_ID=MMETSP0116_2-20130129/27652_1 /TAXON_ID=400756 /ORGANISM="Durinskia baltica, Strain CSIRO CS-38" /LENGTH=283 /DNA_ID=CAMNT_0010506607 /DNA_START=15 /DNA_END=866 /DNA_ORIENTATION=-